MIDKFQPADESEIIECLLELQAAESVIEPIRISNRRIAEMYFKEVQNNISNNSGEIFVSKDNNEITGLWHCPNKKNLIQLDLITITHLFGYWWRGSLNNKHNKD